MLYRAMFYAHCGMSWPVSEETDDLPAVRRAVAGLFRRRRRDHLICPLPAKDDEHARWEVCEPDGSFLVPDTAGLCVIESREPFSCHECGQGYDTADDARECCRAILAGDWSDWTDGL